MGRKKRRWRKKRLQQQEISLGKLVAWAEWTEGEENTNEK